MLRKTLAFTAIAATLALALTGCAPSNSPADLVRDYLQALADGDAQKVLELQPVDSSTATSPLLTAEAFDGATERITNVKAESPTGSSEETAEVPFSYELAGETYTGTAKLAKSEEGKWTFLAPAEGNELNISSLNFPSQDAVESFTVAGITLDPASLPEGNVKIFPGVYDVTVEIDPRFTMTQPAPVVATIDNAVYAVSADGFLPGFAPTPETIEEGVATANAQIAECVQKGNSLGIGCPFGRNTIGDGFAGTWQNVPQIVAEDCTFNDGAVQLECAFDGSGITFQTAPSPGVIPGREALYTADDLEIRDRVVVDLAQP